MTNLAPALAIQTSTISRILPQHLGKHSTLFDQPIRIFRKLSQTKNKKNHFHFQSGTSFKTKSILTTLEAINHAQTTTY